MNSVMIKRRFNNPIKNYTYMETCCETIPDSYITFRKSYMRVFTRKKKVFQYSRTGFYPSTFVYSRFPPKIQFLYCLLDSVAPCCGPMIESEGKIFEI